MVKLCGRGCVLIYCKGAEVSSRCLSYQRDPVEIDVEFELEVERIKRSTERNVNKAM